MLVKFVGRCDDHAGQLGGGGRPGDGGDRPAGRQQALQVPAGGRSVVGDCAQHSEAADSDIHVRPVTALFYKLFIEMSSKSVKC